MRRGAKDKIGFVDKLARLISESATTKKVVEAFRPLEGDTTGRIVEMLKIRLSSSSKENNPDLWGTPGEAGHALRVEEGDGIENDVEALTERRRQIDGRRKTLLMIMYVVIVLSTLPIIPRIVRWSIASIVGVATIVAETTSLGRDRWERFDKVAGIALQVPFVCLALAMSTIRYEEKMSAAYAGLFGLVIIGMLAAIIIEMLRDKAVDRINELKADAEKRIKALYRA